LDKKKLKEFAIYARNELRRQISLRATTFGVTSKGCVPMHIGTDYVEVNKEKYLMSYRKSFEKLFHEVEAKGFDNVIEEVAYTWFNRLIALRYMEVHDYLPSRIRVLSSETPGKIDPDILTEYRHADFPERVVSEVSALLEQNNREGAYRKLLVAQCNELHTIMPFLFEQVTDYTELLLPESLLHADSLINNLARNMDDNNFKHVEVIGWLYQYYISEKKDEVFEGLRKNKKITKENIPAATQLFTPHWIVRYMVENSVGQIWLESHPESDIKKEMTYYVEPAEQEEDVQKKLDKLRNPNLRPEEITVLDPACGSGHILVYAFDLLYKIYEERGYSPREIPTLVLENNLYGIDIDDRAAQLASFALLMKAREKSKRIFRNPPRLNVISIQESNDIPSEAVAEVLGETDEEKVEIKDLLKGFIDAKNYGSILQPKKIDYDTYLARIDDLQNSSEQMDLDTFEVFERIQEIKQLIVQGKMLSSQYDVVVTNPPYMSAKGMDSKLNEYVKKHFKDSKSDLFAVFMERGNKYTKNNGYHAEINQQSWMFLNSFETLRKKIIANNTICSMIHLGAKAFEEIGGEVVQTTTFVLKKSHISEWLASYFRVVAFNNSLKKETDFLDRKNLFIVKNTYFYSIPGNTIAYWLSDYNIFKGEKISDYFFSAGRTKTHNNEKYVRYYWEVSNKEVKWVPYANGGVFRKYYGNEIYVVDWSESSRKFYEEHGGLSNSKFWNKTGVTWGLIASDKVSFRIKRDIFQYSSAAPTIIDDKNLFDYKLLGFLNSHVANYLLSIINPTINTTVNSVLSLPYNRKKIQDNVENIVKGNVILSKTDWNSFETSWDFECHPFLTYRNNAQTLEFCYTNWESHAESQFRQLQQNEEELNRIFIDLYGLQDELTPEVPDEEITVRRADRERDARSFLSYCVGLMMGRYSLDEDGLAYAGGEWNPEKYKTFIPDEDGILPLTENVYFEDDVVSRLETILVTIFGQDTLAENLRWLAESLTMKNNETSVERLRRYFFDEFYKDHCKIYSKRPIYWMIDSGKKKGFRALVYLHRYNTETLAKTRFQYVQDLQEKLRAEQRRLEQDLVNPDLTAAMKKRYSKQLTTIKAQQEELVGFDKKLAELANQRVALDLDDGVVVNYAKLQDVLAKI